MNKKPYECLYQMSASLINASIGGSLTVAGRTTMSGPLFSASTIDCTDATTNNVITNSLTINVNGSLLAGATNITAEQLGYVSGASSSLQNQLNKISIGNLPSVTTGKNNTALGSLSLTAIAGGSDNIGIGYNVLSQTVEGSNNISIGFDSGGGILGTENICIGRNTGTEPSSNFNQSTCIGNNAKISGNNQISLGTSLETVQILGNIELTGALKILDGGMISSDVSLQGYLNVNDKPIYLRANDTKHSLGYDSGVDGPSLQGYGGGRLETYFFPNMLTWSTSSKILAIVVVPGPRSRSYRIVLRYTTHRTLQSIVSS